MSIAPPTWHRPRLCEQCGWELPAERVEALCAECQNRGEYLDYVTREFVERNWYGY